MGKNKQERTNNKFIIRWYDFSVKNNQVKCTIFKNSSSDIRTIMLTMYSGDTGKTIYIAQAK